MSIDKIIRLEQSLLQDLYKARDCLFISGINNEADLQIISKTLSSHGPFRIEHMTPEGLSKTLPGLLKVNELILHVKNYIHYRKLGTPPWTQKGDVAYRLHKEECKKITEQRVHDFFQRFTFGACDSSEAPEPVAASYQPVKGDTYGHAPQQIVRQFWQERYAEYKEIQKQIQAIYKDSEALTSQIHLFMGLIHHVGDLHHQMRFLHFITKTNGHCHLTDISSEQFAQLQADFMASDPLLASTPQPVQGNKPKHKKKKRNKQKLKVVEAQPEVVRPKIGPVPKLNPAEKRRIDLNVRLNSLQASPSCTPAKRLLRWATNDFTKIQDFTDYDHLGMPYKPYAGLAPATLQMHKQNHDIPMHTIHREKDLLDDYSNLNIHQSKKNGTQYGRQFFAEKITKNAPIEQGVILTSLGSDGVLFHCQFVHANKLEQAFFAEHNRTPDHEAEPAPVEEKADREQAPAPFQFEGNYHLEIDAATRDIVIKIGQDDDLSQVIYRIKHL